MFDSIYARIYFQFLRKSCDSLAASRNLLMLGVKTDSERQIYCEGAARTSETMFSLFSSSSFLSQQCSRIMAREMKRESEPRDFNGNRE